MQKRKGAFRSALFVCLKPLVIHVAGPYLAAYAAEMDWREDHRRISNGEQFMMMVSAAAGHPVSRQWKGYWQRERQQKRDLPL